MKFQVIFNQLIFNHALRTRLNTASTNLEKVEPTPAQGDAEDPQISGTDPEESGSSSRLDITAVASSQAASGTATPKKSDGTTGASKQASIQAGSISNLITVDANNLGFILNWNGRAFSFILPFLLTAYPCY